MKSNYDIARLKEALALMVRAEGILVALDSGVRVLESSTLRNLREAKKALSNEVSAHVSNNATERFRNSIERMRRPVDFTSNPFEVQRTKRRKEKSLDKPSKPGIRRTTK